MTKHDVPGPVRTRVTANKRHLNTVEWEKGNRTYERQPIGVVSRGTSVLSVKVENDAWSCSPAQVVSGQTDTCDRDLFLRSLVLRPASNVTQTVSTPAAGGGGDVPLSSLNSVIREELGAQYVTPDIWQYYAQRLTAPAGSREAIQGRNQLADVMQYWKTVRPTRPRGDCAMRFGRSSLLASFAKS